jgi:hypothetical protein
MIISASYKTDIPAFYGQWFLNRLRAGFCRTVNPYSGETARVDLSRDAVDGFVFWTKNLGPFLTCLEEVHDHGYPFFVQYTINAYPHSLEFSVVDPQRSLENAKRLAADYGPHTVVWRYDTIILSSLTPADFHLQNFETLARAMRGATNEVIISFAQIYKKTLRNMNWAAEKFRFSWEDPKPEVKLKLATQIAEIAKSYGMQFSVCAQPEFLVAGACEARCIDASRLSRISGTPISAREKGNRDGCRCAASKDIGEYDTCPHGCVYCYAVRNRSLAQRRYKSHNPEGEFLFEPVGRVSPRSASDKKRATLQRQLF